MIRSQAAHISAQINRVPGGWGAGGVWPKGDTVVGGGRRPCHLHPGVPAGAGRVAVCRGSSPPLESSAPHSVGSNSTHHAPGK